MSTVDIKEIFHVGWADPNWVSGFEATIDPRADIDFMEAKDAMVTGFIEGTSQSSLAIWFNHTRVTQESDLTIVSAVRDADLHCGFIGSPMHRAARNSFSLRLGFLLRSQGVELPVQQVL